MGEEAARQLVTRWFDLWRTDDMGIVEEVCCDPYTRHTALGTETVSLKEYKKRLAQSRRALRNATTTVGDQVVAGDTVWTRATSRGVNLEGESATVMSWITCHRIENGRVAEVWVATLPGVDWD